MGGKPGGVISGEQIIEQSEVKRVAALNMSNQNKKKTNIEVLDDERPIAQYYEEKKG